MAQTRDYYEVLGVKRDATADQIRDAYRRLARQRHPDVNKSEDAAEKFTEIQQAYAVLSDEEKRKAYDRFGHAGVGAGAGAPPGGAGSWSWTDGGGADAPDLGSVFEEIFSGGSPFGGGARAASRPQPRSRRGRDVRRSLTVSFRTAVLGGTERIQSASGADDRSLEVKIPAGVKAGSKLRLKGNGMPGISGGAPGDLILTIEIGGHPWFRRDGLDLFIDVPVTIAEAALGVVVTVPLFHGTVQIKVPAGCSSGQKLRVRGKGMTDSKGKTGDFFAVIQIVGPRELSESAREALEQIGHELKNPRKSAPWADLVEGNGGPTGN